jgi:methenyltetrahydrofolate cyclohydrolase
MKLIDLNVLDFINQVDSNSPAPGGGSVSALISTLGISLARMVGQLSVDKKKFKALDQDIQNQFKKHMQHLKTIKNEVIPLIDKDTDAFNEIMTALKIPKDEKEKRILAIEKATQNAIEVPYKVANISFKALEMISFVLAYGNKQTISDIGVAALSIASGIEGAALNVLINLPGLSDEEKKDIYRSEMKSLLKETHLLKQDILNLVYESLS